MHSNSFDFKTRLMMAAWFLYYVDLSSARCYAILHRPTMIAYVGSTRRPFKDRHSDHYSNKALAHVHEWVHRCAAEGHPVELIARPEQTEAEAISALQAEGFTVLNKVRPRKASRKVKHAFTGRDFSGRSTPEALAHCHAEGRTPSESTVARAHVRYKEIAEEVILTLFPELREGSSRALRPTAIQRRAPDRGPSSRGRGGRYEAVVPST